MKNNENFNNVWLELMGKLNPEFASNNSELIGTFLKTMNEQQTENQPTENYVNLKDLGFESHEELNELVELVPKYNDLIGELEGAEEEIAALKKENQKIKKDNSLLVRTLQKAKQTIGSLNRAANNLKTQNQSLNIELKTKNQFLNNINSFNKQQVH